MTDYYLLIKHTHMSLAVLSVVGFAGRWLSVLYLNRNLHARWLKIVPHVLDSALLFSAALLCVLLQQYPLTSNWLSGKVVYLLAYILCGMWALKWAKSRFWRMVAGLLALLMLGQLLAVVMTRSALGLWA